jgi:hypothetical protein
MLRSNVRRVSNGLTLCGHLRQQADILLYFRSPQTAIDLSSLVMKWPGASS